MILRLIFTAGVFALGYYFGREMSKTEDIRESLKQAREEGKTQPLKANKNKDQGD